MRQRERGKSRRPDWHACWCLHGPEFFCDLALQCKVVLAQRKSSERRFDAAIELAGPDQVGLLFLSYFIFEVTSGKRVHPAQYLLVGTAQIIFYLLLVSLAERIGFDLGFMVAGAATVILLSANAGWIFRSRTQGIRALAIFALL
jgi:inner membrane protein involved in colicin E2 resistance